MLSSFSYGKVKACFLSRGYREGVEVRQVNPAFSSVIGRVKFMERYGLSVHQAAALVLARRWLGCSERIPRRRVAPVGAGVQVAIAVPARKRVKHVWTYWGAVLGQLGPALAAQHRLGRRSGPQIRFRLPGGWLERGSARCSLAGFQDGAALHCWGDGAARTASPGMADDGLPPKSTIFTTVRTPCIAGHPTSLATVLEYRQDVWWLPLNGRAATQSVPGMLRTYSAWLPCPQSAIRPHTGCRWHPQPNREDC